MIILRVNSLVRESVMPTASLASMDGPMGFKADRLMVLFVTELDRVIAAVNNRSLAFVGLLGHALPFR